MTDQPKASRFGLTASHKRLADFCNETGLIAPGSFLDEDGAPTDELLAFCRAANLSLDWLFQDDPLPADGRADLAATAAPQFRTSRKPIGDGGATIPDLFAEWCAIDRAIAASSDDEADYGPLVERMAAIEGEAICLPVETPLDVWRLIRMTSDPSNEIIKCTADALVARAHAEVEG